jgi:hypothetical protein
VTWESEIEKKKEQESPSEIVKVTEGHHLPVWGTWSHTIGLPSLNSRLPENTRVLNFPQCSRADVWVLINAT